MKRSHLNRPICADDGCDVEIADLQKYCAAHQWQIDQWLLRSRAMLEIAKATEKAKAIA